MLTRLIKKLHIYTGLVNFIILMVFGVAGLQATFRIQRQFNDVVETRPFDAPANATDLEVASAAVRALDLPAPMPGQNAVRRDADQHLTFTSYTVNGPRLITVLEAEHQLRVTIRRNALVHFFDNLHATTPRNSAGGDLRIQMWSWYVEFSIWSLIFMSVTGVWLWLGSRPRLRWAQATVATGFGGFLMLYVVMRF